MKTRLLSTLSMLLFVFNVNGTNITVPGSFNTIQEAINNSTNGDTIVVAPGTYYENINFRGKNIVLTSLYYINDDLTYVASTIINGSNPACADTASCVIFNSMETAAAVLQGFTITGGGGTKWLDPHGAGLYREGGGILVAFSSPTIKHNLITGNIISGTTGVISTGGGGIRVGDGNPEIRNNVISSNQSRYGAGIVLNYTGCKIRNNLIVSNTGGQDYYGGSAIWINNNFSGTPKIIENNTISNNFASSSNGTGGILTWSAADVQMKNNIVYGNYPVTQLKTISSAPQVSHSNIQGGYAGTMNIDADPLFTATGFILQSGSPCIDAGDNDPLYNDKEAAGNPGNAQFPSGGAVINDMGAYGGPDVTMMPFVATTVGVNEINDQKQITIYPNPASTNFRIRFDVEMNHAKLEIYNSTGSLQYKQEAISGIEIELNTESWPAGIYLITVTRDSGHIYKGNLVISW